MSFEQNLEKYADVVVRVGINIQPGQQLMISSSLLHKPLEQDSLSLIRLIAQKAYEAGASMVNVIWRDDELTKIRLNHADPETLDMAETWRIEGMKHFTENGGAYISIYSNSPNELAGFDPANVSRIQGASAKAAIPLRKTMQQYDPQWLVMAISNPGWAEVVFPDLTPEEGVQKLWDAIFEICRVDTDDPIAAWETHAANLKKRSQYLTDKAYDAIRYFGPGTDLTIGLPENHIWLGGKDINKHGVQFTANIPTEEVYTTPHKDRVDGTVKATMPLAYGGTIINDFSLTFQDGKVVAATAGEGEQILLDTLNRDEGARRLGEVSIVPHSSPISQSGILFYNTLYDENASCHIALGRAYREGVKDTGDLEDEEFEALGGNTSMIHVDFMIGSGEMNIDGILADGSTEPIMRDGEWAFTL